MDLWSIRIIVEDKFKELFSEYFENFDGYMSSSLFQDKDLNNRYDVDNSYNLSTNKLGEFHLNKYWILEIILNIKPDKKFVKTKLNFLAKQFKLNEFYVYNKKNNDKNFLNKIYISKIINKDWLKENRSSFPSINIDNFYIYGSHIKKECSENKIPIKIDASFAFGTGSHETTRSCLNSLTYLSKIYNPKSVLDYGCGTGILGIASKKIFKNNKITFVDIDINALKLTKQNLRLNNIISREIFLYTSNTMKNFNKKKYYDLIFANILFGSLTSLAPRLKFISKPNSFIVLSGLLSNQITNIVNRYKMFGFKLKKKIIINGWGTVIMKRQFLLKSKV